MSGNKLLDTNILIYLSKNILFVEDVADKDDILHVSIITYMEALGHKFKNSKEKQLITALCNECVILQLDNEIVSEVIKMRQKVKIKLPDAIIFATAKVHNLKLVTANVADFKGLNKRVKIINPF
jgi:predicted nucleic acid-binding protein